jgi:Concanavalin A-like lectin/glucanases superfamily
MKSKNSFSLKNKKMKYFMILLTFILIGCNQKEIVNCQNGGYYDKLSNECDCKLNFIGKVCEKYVGPDTNGVLINGVYSIFGVKLKGIVVTKLKPFDCFFYTNETNHFGGKYGVCYSKINNLPTIEDSIINVSEAISFKPDSLPFHLRNLSSSTKYYIRQYCFINGKVIYHPKVNTFLTLHENDLDRGLSFFVDFDNQNSLNNISNEMGLITGIASFSANTPNNFGYSANFAIGSIANITYFDSLYLSERCYSLWIKSSKLQGNLIANQIEFNSNQLFLGYMQSFSSNLNQTFNNSDWHNLLLNGFSRSDIISGVYNFDLFLDGVFIERYNGYQSFKSIYSFKIGGKSIMNNNNSNKFEGLIDNIRIYDRDLTEQEIQTLYQLKK